MGARGAGASIVSQVACGHPASTLASSLRCTRSLLKPRRARARGPSVLGCILIHDTGTYVLKFETLIYSAQVG
jgi:hypothetical protein